MRVATRGTAAVTLIPWLEVRGRATAIVKISFDLAPGGRGVPAPRPDPIIADAFGPGGVLLFPSDHVRSKSCCDVLVVGRALTLPPAPAHLSGLGVNKVVGQANALGPLAAPAEAPGVQQAPLDQQVGFARLPLRLRYRREGVDIDATVPGTSPQIAVQRAHGLERAATMIDTVALDPERRRVLVTARALLDGIDDPRAFVVVDATGELPVDLEELTELKVTSVILPPWDEPYLEDEATIDRSPIDDEETTVHGDTAVSFDELGAASHTVVEDERTAGPPTDGLPFPRPGQTIVDPETAKPRAHAIATPFERTRSETVPLKSRRASTAALPFTKRTGEQQLAQDASLGRTPPRVGETTQNVPLSPAKAALPFVKPPAPRPPPPPVAPPATSGEITGVIDLRETAPMATVGSRALPFATPGFDLNPVLAPAKEAPPLGAPDMTLERYTQIKAELWTAKEPKRAIFKKYGLSELKWRLVERSMRARVADDKEGGRRVQEMVERLASEVRRAVR